MHSSLVGHLPQVTYICHFGYSMKGWWWWWWNGRDTGGSAYISWHLPYDWGNPQKTSVRKLSGTLSSVTSHCLKCGPIPPNEIGRATLPAPLAKLIWVWPEEHTQKIEIWDPKNPRTSGVPLRATPKKFSFLCCCIPGRSCIIRILRRLQPV